MKGLVIVVLCLVAMAVAEKKMAEMQTQMQIPVTLSGAPGVGTMGVNGMTPGYSFGRWGPSRYMDFSGIWNAPTPGIWDRWNGMGQAFPSFIGNAGLFPAGAIPSVWRSPYGGGQWGPGGMLGGWTGQGGMGAPSGMFGPYGGTFGGTPVAGGMSGVGAQPAQPGSGAIKG